jgi:hypothetical protein
MTFEDVRSLESAVARFISALLLSEKFHLERHGMSLARQRGWGHDKSSHTSSPLPVAQIATEVERLSFDPRLDIHVGCARLFEIMRQYTILHVLAPRGGRNGRHFLGHDALEILPGI